MHCVLAIEKDIARIVQNELHSIKPFNTWDIEICTDAQQLEHFSMKHPDILVLSRFLPGEKPSRLLQHIQTLFPGSHIVLLVGELNEQARGYLRQAKRYGLQNYVTGDIPGERPYTLPVALQLTRPEVINEEDDGLEDSDEPEDEFIWAVDNPPKQPPKQNNQPETDPFWDGDEFEFNSPGQLSRQNNKPEDKNINSKQIFKKDEEINEPKVIFNPPEQRKKQAPKTPQIRQGIFVLATSNKGGVGKTTTAVTIAVALARSGIPVAITDFDFEAPDIATFFDIKEVPGIENMAGRSINLYYLEDLLVQKEENLYVLPGVMDKTIPLFEEGQLSEIVDLLLDAFPVVVGDTPPGFWTKSWIPELLEKADIVYSIVNQSKLSEKETMDYAPKLIECGVDIENIRIVLNQFSPRLHNAKKIEKCFNSAFKGSVPGDKLPRLVATIPQDWDTFNKQMYKGEVAGLDDVYSQWYRLVQEVASMAGMKIDRPEKKGKKGLFGIFDRIKKK